MKNPLLLLIFAFLLGASILARAHAFLDCSEPKVGSTVKASPAAVKIWFTERLDHAQSKIVVFDNARKEVDNQDSKVDGGNPMLMTVSLPQLPDGTYRVEWSAVAVDTHHTQGSFPFTIQKSAKPE